MAAKQLKSLITNWEFHAFESKIVILAQKLILRYHFPHFVYRLCKPMPSENRKKYKSRYNFKTFDWYFYIMIVLSEIICVIGLLYTLTYCAVPDNPGIA